MTEEPIVVRSRRGRLVAQGMALGLAGLVLGIALQSWEALSTSAVGRLGQTLGVPLIALVVTAVSLIVAVTWTRDGWVHSIVLEPDQMAVRDGVGRYRVPYSDIAEVKRVPLGGVAIKLQEPEIWMGRLSENRALRQRAAAVLRRGYDADLLIKDRDVSIGAAALMDLIKGRMERTGRSGA